MSVIVIIDDNSDNVRLAARLLRAEHQVYTAADGEAGLTLVFDLKPDLVLVDLGLPDIDGQTIIAMIRQNPLLSQTRTVAFTAYPEEVAAQIARVYECDGVIHKPIDTRAFRAQVARYLPAQPSALPAE
jgi:CheY-like chemotaxis protein